ncbi:hypothetical protein ACHAWF_015765 [Thalassiosira exigua]
MFPLVRANASVRQFRQTRQVLCRRDFSRPFSSNGQGTDEEAPRGNDAVDSLSATTQWKRNHYQKIEDKFDTQRKDMNGEKPSSAKKDEPLTIDNYEDVQPMWKEMESRVTRRRSMTLEQRGGISGRRNVRKSDEDMWLEAGVYDDRK